MSNENSSDQANKPPLMKSYWIIRAGLTVSTIILLFLAYSLLASYNSNKQQLTRQHTSVAVSGGVTLEVTYPLQLWLNADPGEVIVGLRVSETAAFTSPLTITLDAPPSIAISGTIQGKYTFMEGNGAPAVFLLANQAVLPLNQSQTITLTHSPTVAPTLLIIDMEAAQTAAWRDFILGAISDKSPLLLTLAALLPIVALILQYFQKHEEREETKRRQQEEHQKQELDRQIKQLRHYLVQANIESLKHTWEQINLSPHINAISKREFDWLERLVRLAVEGAGEQDPKFQSWVSVISKDWTTELIGALLCARDKIEADPDPYRNIFRDKEIPLEKVADLSLRNRFIRLWRKVEPFDFQDSIQKVTIRPNTPRESLLDQLEFRLTEDPFLHIYAEDEEASLLERYGFWDEHPIYDVVTKTTRVLVIYGETGCGRTALAKSLQRYAADKVYFWHYYQLHEGLTDIFGLRHSLAEQLLNYIVSKPTLLFSVQENQRRLLAEILVDILSRQTVLAQLERTIANDSWVEHATDKQKETWLKVANTQLELLLQTVEATPDTARLTDIQWMNGLTKCFSLFGFSGVRLLLDCAPDTIEEILLQMPAFQEWQRFNLITTIFVPGNDIAVSGTVKLPLTWTKQQLKNLFAHRLDRLAACKFAAQSFVLPEVYNSFITLVTDETIPLPPTPRKMAQIWQATLESADKTDAISQAAIQQAQYTILHWLKETHILSTKQSINRKRLASLLDETFNDNEFRTLCFALDEDYDNIAGHTKRNKIEELIQMFHRKGRLPELINEYRRLRPRRNWS